jgi:hypothetical protein
MFSKLQDTVARGHMQVTTTNCNKNDQKFHMGHNAHCKYLNQPDKIRNVDLIMVLLQTHANQSQQEQPVHM